MKKFNLLFISLIAVTLLSFTRTEFEGKITYEISMEGGNMPPEAMAMFAGSELEMYVKGTKTKSVAAMGFQKTITIQDSKTNTTVMLMEMMGSKYKIKDSPAKDDKAPEPTVKVLDETKVIAGYKCKKAEISFKDESGKLQSTIVYFTEEISNSMSSNQNKHFRAIKGMPLEYEVKADRGMTLKMTATNVSKEKISDDVFKISSDYKEKTMDEIQKDMMKQMQGGGQ